MADLSRQLRPNHCKVAVGRACSLEGEGMKGIPGYQPELPPCTCGGSRLP